MASIMDLKRMCESYKYCAGCPLKADNWCTPSLLNYSTNEIVDKWVAEHPVKTYAMDFFEKFPNAQRNKVTGTPIPCIVGIYTKFSSCPLGGCPECWNREMKEDD